MKIRGRSESAYIVLHRDLPVRYRAKVPAFLALLELAWVIVEHTAQKRVG